MTTQNELRRRVTDQIVEAVRRGCPPWKKPWCPQKNAGHPANVVTERSYSGVNPLLLNVAASRHGFRSRWWATFNQWTQLGGAVQRRPARVPAGQWGTAIVLFKPVVRAERDRETGVEEEVRFGFLKTYTVFNIDQVDGDHLNHLRVRDEPGVDEFAGFEPAERAIRATGADIRHGGDRAYYRRPDAHGGGDFIQLPERHRFTGEREYYATAIHELVHWSEVRLGWTGSYAEGELRAEIGACYALAELGVPQHDDLDNHHAYVHDWLRALEGDPRLIFSCSTAASKACDYILSFSRAGDDARVPAGTEPVPAR